MDDEADPDRNFTVKLHPRVLAGGAAIAILALETSPTEDAPGLDFTASAVVFTVRVTVASTPLRVGARGAHPEGVM